MFFFILHLILAAETTKRVIKDKNLDAVPDTDKYEGLNFLINNPLIFFSKEQKKDIFIKIVLEIKNCKTFFLDKNFKEIIRIDIEKKFKKKNWQQKYTFKGPELSANWQNITFDLTFVQYIIYILTEIRNEKKQSKKVVNRSLCKNIGHLLNILNVYGKDIFKNIKNNILVNIDNLKTFKSDHSFLYIDGVSILDFNLNNITVSINLSDLVQGNYDRVAKTSELKTSDDNEPSTSHITSLPKFEIDIENKNKTEKNENAILDNDTTKKISGSEILSMLEIKVDFCEYNYEEKSFKCCISESCIIS